MKRFTLILTALVIFNCHKPPPPPINATMDYEIYPTAKDSRGHWNVKVEFPDQPAPLVEGQSYTKKVSVELGELCFIYKVDAFNGLDRGDVVEMDTFVYDEVGRTLYERSEHKETPSHFNSFWPLEADALTETIDVHMHAHVTKSDEPARAHWNIMLWCAPVSSPPSQASDYYTLIRAGTLPDDYTKDCDGSTGMVYALCKQRQALWHQGYKGPEYAIIYCRDRLDIIGLEAEEIDDYVSAGELLIGKTDRFITRLPMEHADFPGRSVVRNTFYRDFQSDLQKHLIRSEEHNASTQTDPCRQNEDYDNIRGWCQKCWKE